MRQQLLGSALIPCVFTLTACSSTPPAPENLSSGNGPTATLRAFDGPAIHLNPGSDCSNGARDPQLTLGPLGFLGAKRSEPGMPTTGDLPRVYHEYIIPAGVPNAIRILAGRDCPTLPRFFIPNPGGFYDVSLETGFWSGKCRTRVRQIIPNEGEAITREIATLPAHRC